MRHIIAYFLTFFGIFQIYAADFKGNWYSVEGNELPIQLKTEASGEVSTDFTFPGAGLIYLERSRTTLRPSRDDFQANILSIDTKFESESKDEVKAVLFIKDKDGRWFQSQKIYYLKPDEWQTLSVKLPGSEKDLAPVGHLASWSSLNAVTIHAVGINVFSKSESKVKFFCKNLKRYGKRITPKLTIYNWEKPATAPLYETIEGRFELSREYLNPFDSDEIKVDIEAVAPNGKNLRWPAFFTQDFVRKKRFNKETLTPVGSPHWAYRFTPQIIGTYNIRINIEDNSPGSPISVKSPWVKLKVTASEKKGFIRVSEEDQRYFEFGTGELFYPIGFNIHTVKDLRSEKVLKLGYMPDKGTYSYEEYFRAMKENGVNSAEIWMAAWSHALEWTSARTNYYGLGRYNLANAWGLDFVLNAAKKNDIYIHLVLDNHGKISDKIDAEWNNAPHNKYTSFATADGGHLNRPHEFFDNAKSWKYYKNRNRYVAGRWGAQKNIFGIELWSEVNLTEAHDKVYNNGTAIEWHKKAAKHFAALDQGKHPITTHTCGDYKNTIKYKKYYKLDEIQYIVGDAYRDHTPFVNHMQSHIARLRSMRKPLLITEYGGSPHGNSYAKLEADLHAGLWASLFTEQAGTPFLWWHDFIHKKHHYDHFKGFSTYMQGIDPRGKDFIAQQIIVQNKTKNDPSLLCLLIGNKKEHYGWIFNVSQMIEYPEKINTVPANKNRNIMVSNLKQGSFIVNFYDTLTGKKRDSILIYSNGDHPVKINLPPFKIDIALKILWQGANKKDARVIKAVKEQI